MRLKILLIPLAAVAAGAVTLAGASSGADVAHHGVILAAVLGCTLVPGWISTRVGRSTRLTMLGIPAVVLTIVVGYWTMSMPQSCTDGCTDSGAGDVFAIGACTVLFAASVLAGAAIARLSHRGGTPAVAEQ